VNSRTESLRATPLPDRDPDVAAGATAG